MISKKKLAAVGVAAAMLVGGTAAYAYFTAAGAGNGSASTGSTVNFTIAQDASTPATGLYPSPAFPAATAVVKDIAYTVTNPGSGSQFVHNVTVSVAADGSGDVLSTAPGSPAIAGCKASWYVITNPTQTLDQTIVAGGNYDETVALQGANVTTIQLVDSTTNQNPCKDASIFLNFVSN